MPSTVTLVHGTWAGTAAWIKPESPLTQELKAQFGDNLVVFPFNWSGKNRHSERISASHELKKKLKQLQLNNPRDKHFVIAHSHGGNVALYALSDASLSCDFNLVCLSTPFLTVKDLRISSLASAVVSEAFQLLCVALFGILVFWFRSALDWPWGWICTMIALVGGSASGQLLARMLQKKATIYLASSTLPALSKAQMLIIRSPKDEASLILAFSELFAKLAAAAQFLLSRLTREAPLKPRTRKAIVILLLVISAVTGRLLSESEWFRDLMGHDMFLITIWAYVFGFIVIVGSLMLTDALFLPTLYLSFLIPLTCLGAFFDFDIIGTGALLEFGAEPTPAGEWEFVNLDLSEENDGLRFAHNTHDSPKVYARIISWIEGRGVARSVAATEAYPTG